MGKRDRWWPSVCLDCQATAPDLCDTCALARAEFLVQIQKREAHNAYHRAYQARARKHPVQGPKMAEAARERMERYRERHGKKPPRDP